MGGGRFLVSLREIKTSERILAMKSLLKGSIVFWNEDVRPDKNECAELDSLKKQLNKFGGGLEFCYLEHYAKEVASVVAGNATKKLISRSQCAKCKTR